MNVPNNPCAIPAFGRIGGQGRCQEIRRRGSRGPASPETADTNQEHGEDGQGEEEAQQQQDLEDQSRGTSGRVRRREIATYLDRGTTSRWSTCVAPSTAAASGGTKFSPTTFSTRVMTNSNAPTKNQALERVSAPTHLVAAGRDGGHGRRHRLAGCEGVDAAHAATGCTGRQGDDHRLADRTTRGQDRVPPRCPRWLSNTYS